MSSTKPLPRVVAPRGPRSSRNASLEATGKMPRVELELLLREASGETRESREDVPPSSIELPLVKRKPSAADAR